MAIAGHRDVPALLQKHGYREIKKVGEGSFGKAILVQTADGSRLICKMVDISKASARETQDALKEGKLLATLKHPYVVRYRENFTEKGWFCILMDYCEGGDLTQQISKAKRSRQPFQEEQILRWLTQAMLGLKYIHDKHILHRDLKPANFFLANGSLQMGDFGIAKVLSSTMACARTQIGTPYYLSPEVCQEKPYSWAADIWAMGCILFEMCALKVPFDAPSISGLVQKICRGPIPTVPGNFSPFTRTLCNEMLNRNANQRPTPEDVLARPRIQSIVKELHADALADKNAEADKENVMAAPVAEKAMDAANGGSGQSYKKGDLVEYNSTAHKDWLNATVVNADGDGRIVIDLKPNTWISKEEQSGKIRPRRGANGNAAPARPSASPMRQQGPHPGAKGVAGSPMVQRSPSAGAFEPPRRGAGTPLGAQNRSPSVDAIQRPQPSPQPPSRVRSADNLAQVRGASPTPSARAPSPSPSVPGGYKKNEPVEYFSATHKDWLPAVVINVNAEGKIVIDLKPNTWLCKDEQASKIRRRKFVQEPVPRRAGAGAASPLRQRSPSAPGSRAGTPQRSPSRGAREPSPDPSARGGAAWRANTPSRAASPRGGAPVVANGTPRVRPPGIPRVADSPQRRRSAVGAAGMVIAGA